MVNGHSAARILAIGMIIIAQMPVSVTAASALTPDDIAKYSEFLKAKPTDSWLDLISWAAEDLWKYITDSNYRVFIKEMKSANPPTAQAIAQKGTEGLIEEQKKTIACADPIYAAGADECKTISAENPKNELGAAPTETAIPDAIYQEIKALPAGTNFSGWSKEPKIYTKQAGEIKSDYIEAVFYGACNGGNALCMGVKVKEGATKEDVYAGLIIERATPWNLRTINIGLGEKLATGVGIPGATTYKEDVENIGQMINNGLYIAIIPNLPEKLKADKNEYVFKALRDGKIMDNEVLNKTRI